MTRDEFVKLAAPASIHQEIALLAAFDALDAEKETDHE